jgi:hypothetical protein
MSFPVKYAVHLTRVSFTRLRTNNDILVWAKARIVDTKEKWEALGPDDDDKLIVLRTFKHQGKIKTQSFDVKTNKLVDTYVDVTTVGVVMTTPRILRFLFTCMLDGTFSLVLQADGTYKLHDGGWTCIDAGTHTIGFEHGEYVHHFIPLIFCMTLSECELSYKIVFKTLRDVAQLFGVHDFPLVVSHLSIDRACYIATAAIKVWAGCIVLQCWPHLIRKLEEGAMTKYLRDKNNLDLVIWLVRKMRECRTEDQFDYVWINVWNFLLVLREKTFASYFNQWYMTGVFKNWFANAGRKNEPLRKRKSAKQSQNGIEKFHGSSKVAIKRMHLRAKLSKVLSYSMPRVLRHAAYILNQHITVGEMPAYFGDGNVGSDELEIAHALQDDPQWCIVQGGMETGDMSFVCRATPESDKVTQDKAGRFLITLGGKEPYQRVPDRSTKHGMENFFKFTHDCNLVVVRKCADGQENPFFRRLKFNLGATKDGDSDDDEDGGSANRVAMSCDCVFFGENANECPHCLAVAHKLRLIDLVVQISSVGAPRNCIGRKRKFGALERATTKTRDAKWHLKNINAKKQRPLWWKDSNVARTFNQIDYIGVVTGYSRRREEWEIFYSPAPPGRDEREYIGRDSLSKGFALASLLGVRAVVDKGPGR